MPVGPRPEPPPVPRKVPRDWHPGYYVNPLASEVPGKPPKTPLNGSFPFLGSSSSLQSDSDQSSCSSPSSLGSPSRLIGPRPLGVNGRPKVPYPESVMQTSTAMPVPPRNDFINQAEVVQSAPEPILMPEPEDYMGQSLSSPASSYRSYAYSSLQSSDGTSVPSLVPPPLVDASQYPRPTKSIFQWGIPAELLPPMPVPVQDMSGLKVGLEGQYTMNIDLPEIPPMEAVRPKFSVEQLTVAEFQAPSDLWSISMLALWIYGIVLNYDAEITVDDARQALTRLFLYRKENLNWSGAEDAAEAVITSLKHQQFITSGHRQLVIRTSGPEVSGVLTQFTSDNGTRTRYMSPMSRGLGNLDAKEDPRHRNEVLSITNPTCMTRSISTSSAAKPDSALRQSGGLPMSSSASPQGLEAVSRLDPFLPLEMNWRKYWNIDEADIKDLDPTTVKLQFAIHELILSEYLYVRDLQIYLAVYGDIDLMDGFTIISKQKEYTARVFERIRDVVKSNEQLLVLMLDRQLKQGPYVQGIADLIKDWASLPQTLAVYTAYATDYLWSDNHLRKELLQNERLQKWMEERAKDPRLTGRPHSFFFNRILPRVARYHLLLGAVLKYTQKVGPESECLILEKAIEESNRLTRACDACVDKQKSAIDVQNLKAHIVFKSSSVTADLKLGDKRRKLIRRGDMLRRGDLKMDWVETTALLLDNFLVLSKTREGMNGTAFYVTKAPVPLDLLVLESFDEEGVVKVSSRITFTRQGPVEETNLPENERASVMFPLRLTHLGSNGQRYVLFIPTRPERQHWANSIIEAKQSRAQLAFARSAEPFKLELIADEFAYPESDAPQLPIPIPDTPLHRAVGEVSSKTVSRISLRRRVNCLATVGFVYLVGTDMGLWMRTSADLAPPNQDVPAIGWSCVLKSPSRIIAIETLDTMNAVLILCGDHNLLWYPLDQIISRGLGDKRLPIGVRLNQSRKIVDFKLGYHRGRVVVTYLQQGGMLKVIEPIRSHGAVSMRTLTNLGIPAAGSCIDSFRELDRLQVSTDTMRLTLLFKCIILVTTKGFEWVTLDTKQVVRIPCGSPTREVQQWGRPVKLIKLDASRVLLCYEACYVICDIAGNVGIQPTTWFLDKCYDCAYYAPYLVLFAQGGEMIEVRYIDEFPGRLVQISTGKDIRLLSSGEDSIYVCQAHPWVWSRQLILQLVGNEVVRDMESTWHSSST